MHRKLSTLRQRRARKARLISALHIVGGSVAFVVASGFAALLGVMLGHGL
jgi:hypothetical protein